MNTTASSTTPNEFFDLAAHMPGMNNLSAAAIAADALRQSTVTPNYDATHERVNEAARLIAEQALELSGGRTTYAWEGNGIRLTYTGDTVDDQGDFAYGPTIREYLVGDQYKTTAPVPSQSGTGLLNLALDHVKDCKDPIVEAKRQITWLLLDPSLDLVEFTIRTSTAWLGLMQMPHKLRTALAIRLAEVVEQKVLENPGGGLDLRDLLEGTNVVGYMVKTLDGSIFNLMKRIITNESKHRNTLDTPAEEDDAFRRPSSDLDTEQYPASAELDALEGAEAERAMAIVEAMHREDEKVAEAKAENAAAEAAGEKKVHTIRSRRAQEKAAMVSRAFFAQTGLPTLVVPKFKTRMSLLWDLEFEDAVYSAAVEQAKVEAEAKSAELGEKVAPAAVDREKSIAFRSFVAWHNLLNGESDPRDGEVSDAWMSVWESFSPEDTQQMLGLVTGHEERVAKIVEGVLAVPEPMSSATKRRIRDTMKRLVNHDEVNSLIAAAIEKYDSYIQGGDFYAWEMAALAVLEHKDGPKLRPTASLSDREEHLKKVFRGVEKKFAEAGTVSEAMQARMLETMKLAAGEGSVNIRFQVAIDKFAAFTQGGDYTEFKTEAQRALDLQPSTAGTVAELGAAFDAAGAQLVS